MVVAGVAGGLLRGLAAGTVVVADRVLSEDGATVGVLPSAHWVAAEVERLGLPVRIGPVVSTRRVVRGTRNRAALADTGAIAVDTETAFVLAALGPADLQLPTAVVRVVVDTPDQELLSPATIFGGFRALRRLKAAAPALEAWTSLLQPRRALLAGPRSFCAGVDRAIATVETAIERFGAPLYVRRQIVHNTHVVADLESRGAVFVQELGEVPDGSTVVLAAHGVSPAVRAEAAGRDLKVIDATCPLVAKVHREARRFSERGFQTVLIGHAGHEEVEGTLGEDARITLLTEPADVDRLEVEDPSRLAYLSQTTLSQADVAAVVERLSQRFPEVTAPPATDICYATQNRQDALSAIAAECGLIVVVGSANSSNAARLVEVAERAGSRAVLVDDAAGLRPEWFAGVRAVGITAAASTPPHLVEEVVAALRGLGPVEVQERVVRTENINFPLPVEVR